MRSNGTSALGTAVTVGRMAETEKESFDHVPPEEKLKILAGFATAGEQPVADGRRDVLEMAFRHDRTASM